MCVCVCVCLWLCIVFHRDNLITCMGSLFLIITCHRQPLYEAW